MGCRSSGGFCDKPVTEEPTVSVVAEQDCFQPSVVRVLVGQELTFTNRDAPAHSVSGVGHQWGWELPRGQSITVRFAQPGTYPYFCHYHLGSGWGLSGHQMTAEPIENDLGPHHPVLR